MSTEPPLTDDEISAVAEQLKEHSGVYTRRDIMAAAAATGSIGVLGALGIDTAEASHGVGQVGEPGDPLEGVYANKLGDASEPIHSADVESLDAEVGPNEVHNADSLAEVHDIIQNQGDPRDRRVKITLPTNGTLTPAASDLPVQLGQQVIIDGQECTIDVTGIGKPVFKHDRSNKGDRDRMATIRDLVVDGDETAGSQAVFSSNVPSTRIVNVRGYNLNPPSGEGVIHLQDGCHFSNVVDCHVKWNPTSIGIALRTGPQGSQPNAATIRGCAVMNCGMGYRIENVAGLGMMSVNAEDNEDWNILATGVSGLGIYGGTFESVNTGVDRDGDGTADPAQIGISPDAANDSTSRGFSIDACHFNLGAGETAIVLGNHNSDHATIGSLRLRDQNGDATGIETSSVARVEFSETTGLKEVNTAVALNPTSTATNILPSKINGGVWKDVAWGGYEQLENFAASHLATSIDRSLRVEIHEDITEGSQSAGALYGANFPAGTEFVGMGKPKVIQNTGGTAFGIRASKDDQVFRNFRVEASTGDTGIGIRVDGANIVLDNIEVLQADLGGIRPGTETVIQNCTFDSVNIGSDDINTAYGSDVMIRDTVAANVPYGSRARWDGVIAGGPMEGADIGSLTGASAGDKAVADGTTATTAYTLWILRSNGDWQRVDGGATITPA